MSEPHTTVRSGRPPQCPPAVVGRAADLLLRGYTYQRICDTFNDEGISTPGGAAFWERANLYSLLKRSTLGAEMMEAARSDCQS